MEINEKKENGDAYIDPELYKQLRARDDLNMYKQLHPEIRLTLCQETDVIYDFIEEIENLILQEGMNIMGEVIQEVQKKCDKKKCSKIGGEEYGRSAI